MLRKDHNQTIFNNNELEMVEESKLLGVVLRSDLSWSANTNSIVSRAYKKLWFLKRLKKLGAEQTDLIDVYNKQIRSILEFAVPVWHSALTVEERIDIERVQKSALSIVLGTGYKSYTAALKHLKFETLFRRRQKLCSKFANKCLKSNKFQNWFKLNDKQTKTRLVPRKLVDVYSFLTELLNRTSK